MTITSTAFQQLEPIPIEYTCDGDNSNPPLTFSEVPTDCASLVLIVDDPDAPHGVFTHWLLYDMSPATMQILANSKPETGREGVNDFGDTGYGGPCPPSGKHRYRFTLYACKAALPVQSHAKRADIDRLLIDNIVDSAELIGTYQRSAT